MNNTIKLSLITTLIVSTNLIAEEKLEDITVTSATKTSQDINDVTSNINVITAQEIEERHYTTVAEALNSLPGVSFTANGGLGKTTSLRVRGMDSRHALILVDGVRYQDPSNTSGASIQHLIISDIERIEVIKGAQSGIWGADAAAGVINIITKKAKEGVSIHASQEFGSFNSSKTDLDLSYKNKDFYIKANHTHLNSDGFTAKVPNREKIDNFEDDGYNNKTSSIQAGLNIGENGKLEVGYTDIRGLSEYDNSGANDETMKSDFKTKLSHINYSHQINNHTISLKHEVSDFKRDEIGTVGTQWGENVKIFNGKTINSEITDTWKYTQNDFLIIGGEKRTTDVDYINTANASNKNDYANKAIFLTNSNKLWNNTIITESIRHDKYDHFDNKTTGKIGLKHTTNFGLIATANYGTAYTAPNIIQVLNPWGAANPNLQPEETKSFDISIEHHGLKLTYFDQKIDNLIAWEGAGYKNIDGTSKIKGYEAAYTTTLFDTIAANLSYTKLNAKDKNGKTLAKRADESIKFGIDYYGIENLHLGLNGEYVGDRKEYLYGGGEVKTGNYTVANFTANYEVDPHLSFYGKVDNITDKYYQTVYGYASSPRAFYAGMKLTY
jgi:vitamin B12 transporter